MSAFTAHEAFQEAHERIESEHRNRWIPLLAAAIAVLAAIFSLLTAQRSTSISYTKNEAILAQSHAGSERLGYESHLIREEIAQLAGDVGREPSAVSSRVAREREAGEHSRSRAVAFEQASDVFNKRAEHLKLSYEIMEAGVTILEISIVFVSIATLAPSRILTLVSVVAIVTGFGAALWGFANGF
jgi:hypothetical protein